MSGPGILIAHSGVPTAGRYYLRYPNGNAPVGAQLAAAASVSSSVSASLTAGSGGGFIPQPGYSVIGTVADGSTFTIVKAAGGFGLKPVDPRPRLWLDPATTGSLTPSPLGRTTATNNNNNIIYVASGGPTGGGWAQGRPVVSADSGTQKTWTLALDIDQWGSGSPPVNAYGAKSYVCRTKWQNYGRYDEQTQNFNGKILRYWSRYPDVLNAPQATPDWYWGISNCRLVSEYNNNASPGPDFAREGQGAGSTDQNAIDNCTAFSGGVPGSPNPVTYGNWFVEEFASQANQNDPGTSPPAPDYSSFVFLWYVEGLNSNQAAFTLPVDTYQWQQYYIRSANTVAIASAHEGVTVSGNMMRAFFWHDIWDGTSGRGMLPIGSYPGYGATLEDDSWCRVHIRNNSSRALYTKTEPQPTSAWSDTGVSVTLRKGRFASYSGNSLVVTDNSGTEHYAGDFE